MTVRGRTVHAAITALIIVTASLVGMGGMAQAKIVVPAGSTIEVDEATINTVVAMFERAEQAVKAHDLETVMVAYSPTVQLSWPQEG